VAADEDPTDSGLARERTVLAWNRSGLAVIVCVAVVLRHLWPLTGADESVAISIIAIAATIWALAMYLLRADRTDPGVTSSRRYRAFRLMTVGTVGLAIGGITLTLFTG
jgi:uncharacterized membrane protein YidH (DUF202 family)